MEGPRRRLRSRALRGKMLAFKDRTAIVSCDLEASLGARVCVQVTCVQRTRRFGACVAKATRSGKCLV